MNLLWLEGVFDEQTVSQFGSISAATNFWLKGLTSAIQGQQNSLQVIGHPVERAWPFGRFFISKSDASLLQGFDGEVVSYLNVPFLREKVLSRNYYKEAFSRVSAMAELPHFTFTYSCLTNADDAAPANQAAQKLRERFGIPWICIVADGATPPGADGYIYLSWTCYEKFSVQSVCLHLDGGIAEVPQEIVSTINHEASVKNKALMYMGALTQHGGATELAQAFSTLPDNDIELWVCGRGENAELKRVADADSRIKLIGFLPEDELNKLASKATAFANPRPVNFEPNKFNYPSKILHYLAFGKPIISTFTNGISPDYRDILDIMEDETEACLKKAIQRVLNMPESEYLEKCSKIADFAKDKRWHNQAERLTQWLSTIPRRS